MLNNNKTYRSIFDQILDNTIAELKKDSHFDNNIINKIEALRRSSELTKVGKIRDEITFKQGKNEIN